MLLLSFLSVIICKCFHLLGRRLHWSWRCMAGSSSKTLSIKYWILFFCFSQMWESFVIENRFFIFNHNFGKKGFLGFVCFNFLSSSCNLIVNFQLSVQKRFYIFTTKLITCWIENLSKVQIFSWIWSHGW